MELVYRRRKRHKTIRPIIKQSSTHGRKNIQKLMEKHIAALYAEIDQLRLELAEYKLKVITRLENNSKDNTPPSTR